MARDRKVFKMQIMRKLGGKCRLCEFKPINHLQFKLMEDFEYFDYKVPHYNKWTKEMMEEFLPGFSIVCMKCLPYWEEFSHDEAMLHELAQELTQQAELERVLTSGKKRRRR
jgi:hypothetical protein